MSPQCHPPLSLPVSPPISPIKCHLCVNPFLPVPVSLCVTHPVLRQGVTPCGTHQCHPARGTHPCHLCVTHPGCPPNTTHNVTNLLSPPLCHTPVTYQCHPGVTSPVSALCYPAGVTHPVSLLCHLPSVTPPLPSLVSPWCHPSHVTPSVPTVSPVSPWPSAAASGV